MNEEVWEKRVARLRAALREHKAALGVALTRAEKAEAERDELRRRAATVGSREYWMQRAEKAEAERDELRDHPPYIVRDNGVAMLRRLLEWANGNAQMGMVAWSDLCDRIDRLIAEAEKPAEPPKDREGDDVLRNWYAAMEDPDKWDHDELLARMGLRELCRRALGEGEA